MPNERVGGCDRRRAAPVPASLTTWWKAAVVALVLAAALLIFSPLVADPDLWGHVRFGQDLLQSGRIVRPDIYSYLTEGQRWINHEWLVETIDALLYTAFGPSGLILLNVALGLLIVGLLCGYLLRRGVGAYSTGVIVLFATMLLRPGVLNIRPQVFTYLLFTLVLLIIDAVERGTLGWLWAIPPVVALWANLHGGVIAGVGTFLIWGAAHLATVLWRRQSLRALLEPSQLAVLACMIACPLAMLVNPYGTELVKFLFRTVMVARPEIADWKPVRISDTWSQLYFIGLFVAALGLVYSRRERRPALVVTLISTAMLPLLSVRHIPLFAVAIPILAGEHLADVGERWFGHWLSPRVGPMMCKWWIVPLLFGAALGLAGLALPRLSSLQIDPAVADFPVRAVALLRESGAEGNMATEFNWGEYVLWHLGPEIKVSVDGRRETIYSDAIYRENLTFMLGQGDWDRLVDRSETDLALVDRGRPAYELMKLKPGWALLYEDALASLFARTGSPLVEQVRRTPALVLPADGKGLAFP